MLRKRSGAVRGEGLGDRAFNQCETPRNDDGLQPSAGKLLVQLFTMTVVAFVCGFSQIASAQVTPVRGSLPPPDPSPITYAPIEEYRIGPFDVLDVNVFGIEKLSKPVQVDGSGRFSYPLIGIVDTRDKTAIELAAILAARLGERYLQSPQVTVFVKQSARLRYTVEGAVKSPGVYDLQGETSLLQAMATAKGVDDIANIGNIVIFRVVNNEKRAAIVNLADVRKGKLPDPQIYAGDKIVVPTTNSLKVLHEIVGVSPLLYLFGL